MDGSDSARQAARWAGAIAERFRVPLHVVHAMPRFGGPDPSDVAAFYRAALLSYHADNAEAFLESASKAVRAEHSDLEVSTSATAHPVDDLLEELSARAVMIVLGGVDVTPAAAFLLGSTTLTLAARSRCPVVAWRGHHTDVTADSIVVGVDDSPGGRACLGVALDFADRLGVAVRVVHSWSKVRPDDGLGIPMLIDWVALERNQRAAIEQWVDDAAASHPDVGVECFLESTSPSRALLAHVGGAQLVMVGNRARHPLAVAALGSTSLNMLHHSAIPVAVCHVARNAE